MKNFSLALCIVLTVFVNKALGSEAGMPQLDPEFWMAQIFWLVLVFSVLYLVIWKIFLPKITYSIENRKSKIVNDLNEAQKLREKTETKLLEYNKIIENSKKEAKKIIENSKKNLEQDIRKKKEKFDEEIEKELLKVEEEINDLRKSSILNISSIAKDISSEMVKQIIDTEVNQSNVSAIVKDIVKKKIEKHI